MGFILLQVIVSLRPIQEKMQPIRMVDLLGQHEKIKDEINKAIAEVLDATAFIKGPAVLSFEKELGDFLGVKHVIGCANGTDALQLALMALDLPEGSEVITPDFTFVATAEVIRLLKLKPVLVDVGIDNFNILPECIEEAITDKTKAIIPVHLFGQCADMNAIMEIAERHNLKVIEDNAQALGAEYIYKGKKVKAGTIGHLGCTSFFPSKNLGAAGDAGAVFTNDDFLDDKIRSIANHGQDSQYEYREIGINSRLDTLQASILRVKLRNLGNYNKARQESANAYDLAFKSNKDLIIPFRTKDSTHIFHQYTLRVINGARNDLGKYLDEKKIPNKVYYPIPIHEHAPYKESCQYEIDKLGNSIQLAKEVISLPMHTELSAGQLQYICEAVNSFF
jgi:UDP-2-acetamido-2-deoxy-ribo-hexuluronate aminotransferase